jgi:hypothetical protein
MRKDYVSSGKMYVYFINGNICLAKCDCLEGCTGTHGIHHEDTTDAAVDPSYVYDAGQGRVP